MLSRMFPIIVNRLCNHRIIFLFVSFFVITPPPLWETRKRVWKIADNAINLLDIGCGYACFTRSSKARHIVGVDLDRNVWKEGYQYRKSNFDAVLADATYLPFKDQVFDVIIMTEVLEHIPNDKLCIKNVYRVLQSKGKLLITTPNGDHLTQRPLDHVRHYKEQDLISMLSPFFNLISVLKRFDISWHMSCRFTSFRTLKRGHTCQDVTTKERINVKYFVFAMPFFFVLSPIINIVQHIEDKMGKGKYNLVIEGMKL